MAPEENVFRLRNEIRNFIKDMFNFLVDKDDYVYGLLVKKHSSNLQTQGDFSFPNLVKSWHEFLNSEQLRNSDGTLLQCINKDLADLVETSKSWAIPIAKAFELKDRIFLCVDRLKSIQVSFPSAIYNNNYILDQLKLDNSDIYSEDGYGNLNCISYLRLKLLTDVVKNLYLISIHPRKTKIKVTWKSNTKQKNESDVWIVSCGEVLNGTTGAKETTTAEEFIRKRQEELTLIAQHKYGLRVSSDAKWKEFIAHLGEAAIAFELLQSKSRSSMKISLESNGGTSKGVAFILYNCARLETILKTFNQKVAEGSYPTLPLLENIDLSLLNDKDEWNLIFNYVMGLPNLIELCVEFTDTKCEFRPHLICNFLLAMVRTLSQYYRRVKILTEPRSHLLPVLFARIHLITILINTMKLCLRILNIKSVSQMYNFFFIPTLVCLVLMAVNYNHQFCYY